MGYFSIYSGGNQVSTIEFLITDIDFEVILGQQWMCEHNATLCWRGGWCFLNTDDTTSVPACVRVELPLDKAGFLAAVREEGTELFLCVLHDTPTRGDTAELDPDVVTLLEEFGDVFVTELPDGVEHVCVMWEL